MKNEEVLKKETPEEEIVPPIDEEFSLRVEISDSDEEHILKIEDEFVEHALSEPDHDDDAPPTAEDEERHQEHLRRKKNDKIFNNSYNVGDGGTESSDYSSNIRLSTHHSESHLHDPEKYKDHLDLKIFQEDIQRIIDNSPEILKFIPTDPAKKKYSKQDINFLFCTLKEKLSKGSEQSRFISSIYLLEAVSNITTLEYRKLFDMLEYEYKEDLLQELNQKYRILEHHHKTKKLF